MAKEVGGDFFDVIPFEVTALDDDETLGVLIADVADKGVPAALFMALSRIVVRVNALVHDDPAQVITRANDVIAEDATAGMFVTLFYGLLSRTTRTLQYVNAGHNPPMVVREDGTRGAPRPDGHRARRAGAACRTTPSRSGSAPATSRCCSRTG